MEEGQGKRYQDQPTMKDLIILEQKRHIKRLTVFYICASFIQAGLFLLIIQLA